MICSSTNASLAICAILTTALSTDAAVLRRRLLGFASRRTLFVTRLGTIYPFYRLQQTV